MTALIVIGAIIVGAIFYIVDEGSFLSKLALSGVVAAVGFALLGWIVDWGFMMVLAKISVTTAILSTLVNIIIKIAG